MQPSEPRFLRRVLAVALLLGLVGASCVPKAVEVLAPTDRSLVDDPAVAIEVRVARTLDPESAAVRIDGVDVVAALGLTPPFADAAGVVSIGGTPVAISDFDYEIPSLDPVRVRLRAAGLAPGAHALEAEAFTLDGLDSVLDDATFDVVAAFALALDATAASGGGPITPLVQPSRKVARATLGDPLAGSASTPGVGAVDTGFFSAAQALQP
jgi:hypothetical protein